MYFVNISLDLHLTVISFPRYRRIVGVAHVEDFESISDPSKRAACERRALQLAKLVLKGRRNFNSIDQVISAIRQV